MFNRHDELTEVKRRLKEKGYHFDLYMIQAVMDTYDELIHDTIPIVDNEDRNEFILNCFLFDPEIDFEVTPELINKFDIYNVEFLESIGIIPKEDEDENDED